MYKKILTFALVLALFAPITLAGDNNLSLNQVSAINRAKLRQEFESRKKAELAKLYVTLSLTEQQIEDANKIENKYKELKKTAIKDLFATSKKFNQMKKDKACKLRIKLQERRLKLAYKHTHAVFEKSQKEFEAILTPEQLEKFRKYQEQRKAELSVQRQNFKRNNSIK